MSNPNTPRRVIQVNKQIIGPTEPRAKTVCAKRPSDYPGERAAYLSLARKLTSPLLMGPPLCDELVALVKHTFTGEEAEAASHLGGTRGRTAQAVARRARLPLETIEAVLDRLACQKRAIGADGPAGRRRYRLMPVMPGMFELVLIGQSPETMTGWHRRFAELFEALFATGYTLDYQERAVPFVRFLPVGGVLGMHPAALPADRLEVVLDRYDTFGVGHCQCRMSNQVVGEACSRPLEVCTAMGQWAEMGIEAGWLRPVSRQNVLEIKREAESHGLVTWIMNIEAAKGQCSCSCCGCCCKAMRMVNEFSAPGMMAPPHFMPRFDRAACACCGHCAQACPMGAITVDVQAKTLTQEPARCIGCGLCTLACQTKKAIHMEPVPAWRLPYKSFLSLLLKNSPNLARTAWKVWRDRP